MSNVSRIETATAETVDWSYAEREGLLDKIDRRCKRLADDWFVEADDLFQFSCLWLAANPRVRDKTDAQIILDLDECARQMGQKEHNYRDLTVVSLDDLGPDSTWT